MLIHFGNAFKQVPIANAEQGDHRNENSSRQQTKAIDGIGKSHGFQPPKNSIHRANGANTNNSQPQTLGPTDAQHLRNIENTFEIDGTGVQHNRQQGDDK